MANSKLMAVVLAAILSGPLAVSPSLAGDAAGNTAQSKQVKVVYHINDASVARMAMRNIENNLNASPNTKIVVVTHGKGIDFLLNDAKDEKGAYEPQVAGLKDRGVEFHVCHNTLMGRKLSDDAVIMEAKVVPSGVADLANLQALEGYVYIKP